MTHVNRRLITFCLGTGLTFIAAGLFPLVAGQPAANAQDATPEVTPAAALETTMEALAETTAEATSGGVTPTGTGDNGYCTVCHNQPWRAVTLQDGYILNLYVDPQTVARSVHGDSNPQGALGCVDCHGENSFPHNGPTPVNSRVYSINAVQMCNTCHEQEAADLQHGLHEKAIQAGNLEAAVCTDCHGAHDVQPATNHPQLVAGVCGDCHKSTYEEWRNSPHVDIGPLGCAKCHSQHSQELLISDVNELCTNCHKQPGDIYIHKEHMGSTLTEVTCADCHMYRDSDVELVSVEFQPTGHTMRMDTRPCNSCHEQLEISGQWPEIAANQVNETILAERDALQKRVAELEAEVDTAPAETTPNTVQLTQGLIIGLGLGLTLALVFIPRFVRNGRRKEESDNE
ncbi:MAG: hypothetical protein HZC41_14585 [Chloroflexi bacterium]|nr:hypothetical protein [Chloroflexota bacterium]